MHVHQTTPGNVVEGLWSYAKDAWGTKKFGGGYTALFRVELRTHYQYTMDCTLHTTHVFYNENASLGEYAGICIEGQTNMPTREETCYGGWHVDCRCADSAEAEGRWGVAPYGWYNIHVFLTRIIQRLQLWVRTIEWSTLWFASCVMRYAATIFCWGPRTGVSAKNVFRPITTGLQRGQ